MLRRSLIGIAAAMTLAGGAGAQTIVIMPEPGSMNPPTIIVDRKAGHNAPVLVCSSISQISAGTCSLRGPARR